jgi:RHS repeat-associated protein
VYWRLSPPSIGISATDFLYDGLNPVQEQTSGGSVTANLLDGLNIDEYFTRTGSGTTSTFLADALGSTIGLVTANGGPIATSYSYEPFGATTQGGAGNTNPYQFTGRESDGTGLYYYRARYYSALYQRFIAEDPIGFARGDVNLYAYVLNDPASLVDRLGRQVVPQYANLGSPDYDPGLEQELNQYENGGGDEIPINTFPPGEPGLFCAAPPPPPPPQCTGGPIGAEGVGLLAGSGFVGGYLAGGPIGSAIVGGVTTVGAAALAAQCGEE